MGDHTTICTAMQPLIQGVSNAGQVHTYVRYGAKWDALLEQF